MTQPGLWRAGIRPGEEQPRWIVHAGASMVQWISKVTPQHAERLQSSFSPVAGRATQRKQICKANPLRKWPVGSYLDYELSYGKENHELPSGRQRDAWLHSEQIQGSTWAKSKKGGKKHDEIEGSRGPGTDCAGS